MLKASAEYYFTNEVRDLYGNKGRNLMLLRYYIGLNVPHFVILDTKQLENLFTLTEAEQLHFISTVCNNFPFDEFSIRSSPNYSLPGILDTHLNVSRKEFGKVLRLVKEVYNSVHNERVNYYKQNEGITDEIKTAVILQKMVYGNKNLNSGTGVFFSSNPINGDNEIYGEYLVSSQGEALVGGTKTPKDIKFLLEEKPYIYNKLKSEGKKLENFFKEIQDIEFTYEDDVVYFLQTRNAKKTDKANLAFKERLLNENKITLEEFEQSIKTTDRPNQFKQDINKDDFIKITEGIGGSSGLIYGRIVLTKSDLVKEEPCIYISNTTSTDNIDIISNVQGILTITGGKTSHAAIVSRSWGKVCVVGCNEIKINKTITETKILIKDLEFKVGDYILLDGDTGEVFIKKQK